MSQPRLGSDIQWMARALAHQMQPNDLESDVTPDPYIAN
ncbi:hypothetical protein RTCIAT899_PB02135 (plasmid) [Rhizobium tropici CIAT 899]|nr:hypothetical protein RTCIAT899_PB02135 [Rhizobium tropici CIAT 899]